MVKNPYFILGGGADKLKSMFYVIHVVGNCKKSEQTHTDLFTPPNIKHV